MDVRGDKQCRGSGHIDRYPNHNAIIDACWKAPDDYSLVPCINGRVTITNTAPTTIPTAEPTTYPTNTPSAKPSNYPTNIPTLYPTIYPTYTPSAKPTINPSNISDKILATYSEDTPTAAPYVGFGILLLLIIYALFTYFRGRKKDEPNNEQDPDQDPIDEEVPIAVVEIPINIVVDAIVDDPMDGAPTDQTAYATLLGLVDEELPAVTEPIAEQLGGEEQVAVEPLAILTDTITPTSENNADDVQK